MSVLELKGSLLELISKVQNEETLLKLINVFKVTVDKEDIDWWDELSQEQQNDILEGIAQTDDPSKLTAHEEVVKMSNQWINE